MDTNELNKYIKNYLLNDKTQRAIMLTAPWGSGKSYYIKNSLCPFLLENELDYAIVSLYGLKEIKEVSKNLYLEVRAKKLNGKSEKLATGKIIGKTLLKGVASFFGVDLSQSEQDLQNLYESIDLSNKLIIFEDLERTGIDIGEFLGYVNNLTEHDGVKVLIVANEHALINRIEVVKDKKDYSVKEYVLDENSQRYLAQKEKTIGDTIYFLGNSLDIIKGVYGNFENKHFNAMICHKNKFTKSDIYEKIQTVMQFANCNNYRSLLYACQKVEEVFNKLTRDDYDVYFLQNVLLGTIAHCVGPYFNGDNVWKDVSITSATLGSPAFPLYKFMFDYIKFQYFNIKDFDFAYDLFLKSIKYAEKDKYLKDLYNYYVLTEKEVVDAIDNIHQGLQSNTGLMYNEYIKISNYLIAAKSAVGCKRKINDCKNLIKTNLNNALDKGEQINFYTDTGLELSSEADRKEFHEFKQELYSILENKKNTLTTFDYKPESISKIYEEVNTQGNNLLTKNGFAINLNIEKLTEMIPKCSASQLNHLRVIFLSVYRNYSDIKMRYSYDLENLIKLKNNIDLITENNKKIDKIQKHQLSMMSGNLQSFIDELKGGQNAKTE